MLQKGQLAEGADHTTFFFFSFLFTFPAYLESMENPDKQVIFGCSIKATYPYQVDW